MRKQVIGIIGGGQLARMIAQINREKNYNHQIIVLDPTEPTCPAMTYADSQIIGPLNNHQKIQELGKNNPDVITIEVEHTSAEAMQELEEMGLPVFPSSKTVKVIQDKWLQYQHLLKYKLPTPQAYAIENEADLKKLLPGKYMLKQRIGSYDGRGNYLFQTETDLKKAFDYFQNNPFMAQTYVPFDQEISVIVARDTFGQTIAYDCAENIHTKESILDFCIVPARIPEKIKNLVKEIALQTVESFQDVGVMAVEMFYREENQSIQINEIAPRVHNSGHWTMDEICTTSQFEQHLRAISGEKLSDTERRNSVIMINLLGPPFPHGEIQIKIPENILPSHYKTFVHFYEKSSKPGRKIGHINLIDTKKGSIETLLENAIKLKNNLIYLSQ